MYSCKKVFQHKRSLVRHEKNLVCSLKNVSATHHHLNGHVKHVKKNSLIKIHLSNPRKRNGFERKKIIEIQDDPEEFQNATEIW